MKIIVVVPIEWVGRQTDEDLRASGTIRLISCVICVSSLTSEAQELPDSGWTHMGSIHYTRCFKYSRIIEDQGEVLLLLRRRRSCLKFQETRKMKQRKKKDANFSQNLITRRVKLIWFKTSKIIKPDLNLLRTETWFHYWFLHPSEFELTDAN